MAESAATSGSLQVILQSRDLAGGMTCLGFSGLPAVAPAHIEIIPAPTAAAETAAHNLTLAIANALRAVSPSVQESEVPCGGYPGEVRTPAPAHGAPEWRKVLVVVADAGAPDLPMPLPPLVAAWLASGPAYAILPMLQRGLVAERYLADPSLGGLNASWWSRTPAENVDEVLALADLTAEERRVFVSYRRPDTLNIAEQLFEVLEKHRFDVFVDRFRVPPGHDVQERLTDELAHKSMVLVLESATILQSKWVEHELNFARDHELGHLAVHLPGAVRVPALDDAYRVEVKGSELEPPLSPDDPLAAVTASHKLSSAALARVVAALISEHTSALLRRRGTMLESLRGALAKHGNVEQKLDAAGHLHATATRPSAGASGTPQWADPARSVREYVVWTTPRPPEIEDFRVAHGVCEPEPKPAGAIVTAAMFRAARRSSQAAWLAGRSLVRLYEKTNMGELAAQIARGENLA